MQHRRNDPFIIVSIADEQHWTLITQTDNLTNPTWKFHHPPHRQQSKDYSTIDHSIHIILLEAQEKYRPRMSQRFGPRRLSSRCEFSFRQHISRFLSESPFFSPPFVFRFSRTGFRMYRLAHIVPDDQGQARSERPRLITELIFIMSFGLTRCVAVCAPIERCIDRKFGPLTGFLKYLCRFGCEFRIENEWLAGNRCRKSFSIFLCVKFFVEVK